MIKCVVIDDEPLARECLTDYINKIDFLQLEGVGNSPLELSKILNTKEIDLIFLDIQMPIINGIDFIKTREKLPMIIITTAYPAYALEGYDLNVLDYLLKPITFSRFLKATNKAREQYLLKNKTSDIPSSSKLDELDSETYCFIKCDGKFVKVVFNEILFIQSLQNYVTIYTSEGKHVTMLSLKSVFEKLDSSSFIYTHKSYIVSLSKILAFESHQVTIEGHKIPLSRNYRKEVSEKILGNNLWRKN